MSRPQGEVLLASSDDYPRHSEASTIRLKNGDILLAWTRFKATPDADTGDNMYAQIAAMTSKDGGHTWSDERILVDNAAGLNVMSPALRYLPNGHIGMVYSHRDSVSDAHRVFCWSEDEGQTWSDGVRISQGGYKTGCHDRFVVLKSGRLVTPLHCSDNFHEHYLYGLVAYSDDMGKTWSTSDRLELPRVHGERGSSGINEPGVIQRNDGSLLMVIRTKMGTIFRAESHDEGETWQHLRSMEVVAPVSPSRIEPIPNSNDLLLIWNWNHDASQRMGGTRRPLALAISSDGGNSWPWARRKIIEDDPAYTYSYPSCLFLDDSVLLTYDVTPVEGHIGNMRSLKVMHVPLNWLYD